jgi:hypothetical protein
LRCQHLGAVVFQKNLLVNSKHLASLRRPVGDLVELENQLVVLREEYRPVELVVARVGKLQTLPLLMRFFILLPGRLGLEFQHTPNYTRNIANCQVGEVFSHFIRNGLLNKFPDPRALFSIVFRLDAFCRSVPPNGHVSVQVLV